MKNLVFFSLVFFIVSCNDAEQHRTDIESLSTKWEMATSAVTDFQNLVMSENDDYTQLINEVSLDESALDNLVPDVQTKIMAAKEACQNAGSGFGNMIEDINVLMTEWSEKSTEVISLQEGLETGQLEGDVPTKISELTDYLSSVEEKLMSWKETLAQVKEGCSNSHSEFITLVHENLPDLVSNL